MIMITKIDFQGDDLYIQYRKPEDVEKKVKFRAMVVDWKSNKEISTLLCSLFQAVASKYFENEPKKGSEWEEFMADLKKYEERQK